MLIAGLIGAAIGACRRPLGVHLEAPRVVLPGVVVVGALLQILLGVAHLPAENQLFAASLGLLTGFAVVNRHIVGMGVLAIGLCCNFAAVLVHGGMPVRATALIDSGAVEVGDLADTDLGAGRRFERTDDLAPILGDVIPVEPFHAAMSFGDLIALAGIGSIACELTRYAKRGSRWSLAGAATRLVHDWGLPPDPHRCRQPEHSAQSRGPRPTDRHRPHRFRHRGGAGPHRGQPGQVGHWGAATSGEGGAQLGCSSRSCASRWASTGSRSGSAMAPRTSRNCTVPPTSWTRNSECCAEPAMAATAARVPGSRSRGAVPVTAPMKSLRDTAHSSGRS